MKVVQIGDIAGVALELTRGLRALGLEANLLLMPKPGDPLPENEPGVELIRSSVRALTHARLAARLLTHYSNCNIFHAHSLYNIPLMLLHKLTLSHFHGSDLRESAADNSIIGRLLRRSMRHSRKIVVSTPDLLRNLKDFGIPAEKCIFLPNPIDVEKFRPRPSPVKLADQDRIKLFHPARFQKIKGNEKLFYAYRQLQDKYPLSLHLVRDQRYSPELGRMLDLIEKLQLKQVYFLSPLEHAKMADYYNASDIVLGQFSPYMVELVSLEAAACAKPVVTSLIENDRSYPEFPPFRHAFTVEEIIESISWLIDNRNRWKEIGNENRDWVIRHHAQEKICKRLSGIYAEISS